jgi:hypothetical protein
MFEGGCRKRGVIGLVLAILVATSIGPSSPYWERCAAPPQRKLFLGVIYGCEFLQPTSEGRGVVHWVRVELGAPGIELYVTPLNRSAVSEGWQYRLRWIDDVVKSERLAVAVNGTLFTSTPTWRPRMPGDLANGVETVVSDHVVSHLWEHTYLLWFNDQLAPHLRPSKPPTSAELREAKWGIGGQGVGLQDGEVSPESDRRPDSRTAIAIDQRRKLLFVAVAQWISPHLLLEKLSELGAHEGMLLDGGGSSAMAIGQGARGISPEILFGGSRPVATYFGIKAAPAHGTE